MRLLLSNDAGRTNVESIARRALRLLNLGAEVRGCVPPYNAPPQADVGAPHEAIGARR